MNPKSADQIEREVQMYGCDIDHFVNSITNSITYKLYGKAFVVVSILSDVQEMIERNMKEEARQTLNKVKYVLMTLPEHTQLNVSE